MSAKDKYRGLLTQRLVRKLFFYNPHSGMLCNRMNREGGVVVGTVAGTVNKYHGRRVVSINGVKYYASRIIWLYVVGKWPKHEIDHKNQIKSDDRWNNLREATSSNNVANRAVASGINKHGFRGVKQQSRKEGRKTFRYYASIKVNRQDVYLGRFDSLVEAAKAYDLGAIKYFGEFAHTNFPRDQYV